jgi:hypothetical protein
MDFVYPICPLLGTVQFCICHHSLWALIRV